MAPVDWIHAIVPGTVASALLEAGLWTPDQNIGFDAFDFWYASTLEIDASIVLQFEGLATLADVFLNDRLVLETRNMFRRYELEITGSGTYDLTIAFRSLDRALGEKKGRARWRPKLAQPATLRFARTALLGHIPGWGPAVHAVGPYRPIRMLEASAPRVLEQRVRTRVEGTDGVIDVEVRLSAPTHGWVTARCGTIDFALIEAGDGVLRGEVIVPDVALWWPHTHGEPTLYPLQLFAGDQTIPLGATGFRTLTVDRDKDGRGFGLTVNGVPIFCRGACWTTADIVGLSSVKEAYRPLLMLARDAGMNMLRVGGTMGYEGDAFYSLCDELGILIWQDFAFSNFDYPAADLAFQEEVRAEARDLLMRLQGSPSLAVFCGASEVAQQAAMLGMPSSLWSNSLFDDLLRSIVEDLRPDTVYTPHSPWGGPLPFCADQGISHYYGVSAHLKPIEDARRAAVRFSAESLGFANVPDGLNVLLEPDRAACRHPNTIERLPYDMASAWAFEDVRNHYTSALYDIDVDALRREDPELFLYYARATSAEVMEATFAEWRRHGSETRGALVWFFRDLFPGAGWGVLDHDHYPKAAYWGLKRAFKPVTVSLTDEGMNGLHATLINETASVRTVRLRLLCLRDGVTPVMDQTTDPLDLAPRSTIALTDADVFGGFFDTTYSFRFGPASHDTVVALLMQPDDQQPIATAFLFPCGRGHRRSDVQLVGELLFSEGSWALSLSAQHVAQSVRIIAPDVLPDDNYFHLAPGNARVIRLTPLDSGLAPSGEVTALNHCGRVLFGA